MEMWCLIYLEPPDNLRREQGTQFVSPKLPAMAAGAGITCRPVGFESSNPMSVGERCHDPLRKKFLKLQITYGIRSLSTEVEPEPHKGPGRPKNITKKPKWPITVDDKYLLSISVMCINSTIGPEEICLTLLVFGAVPKLPLPGSLPASLPQAQRMMMMETAREESTKIIGEIRLRAAEKAFVSSTPPLSVQYGDKILVYRDTSVHWGPRTFVSRNDDTILVMEPNGVTQPYSKTKVSEYKEVPYLLPKTFRKIFLRTRFHSQKSINHRNRSQQH